MGHAPLPCCAHAVSSSLLALLQDAADAIGLLEHATHTQVHALSSSYLTCTPAACRAVTASATAAGDTPAGPSSPAAEEVLTTGMSSQPTAHSYRLASNNWAAVTSSSSTIDSNGRALGLAVDSQLIGLNQGCQDSGTMSLVSCVWCSRRIMASCVRGRKVAMLLLVRQ